MDIITRISRQRGKMQIVISEQETIVVPLSLFRERPLTEGQPINLEEYDNWLMVRQYRHALDRAVACLAARAGQRACHKAAHILEVILLGLFHVQVFCQRLCAPGRCLEPCPQL